VKDQELELWEAAKAQQLFTGSNSYIQGFTNPFAELAKRAISLGRDPEETEWLQTFAKRILIVLRPEEKVVVKIASFDEWVNWLKLLGSDELKEALPNWWNADSWSSILRLVKQDGGSRHLSSVEKNRHG
jgi:hypothetical protein